MEMAEDEDMSAFDDLPEFANEANRALHRQLKDSEKALVVVESELIETKERIGTMEEHLKSVNTEQLHTQRLVDAKIKEIETEDHLKQLAERGAFYCRPRPRALPAGSLTSARRSQRRAAPDRGASACPRASRAHSRPQSAAASTPST